MSNLIENDVLFNSVTKIMGDDAIKFAFIVTAIVNPGPNDQILLDIPTYNGQSPRLNYVYTQN